MKLLLFWLSLITGTLITMLTGYIFTSLFLFLIFGSLASMVAGNFVLAMFLFLVFSINVAYNFTK